MGCCCLRPLFVKQPNLLPLPDSVQHITEATLEEASAILGRATAGTDTTDPEKCIEWMLGPSLKGKWNEPDCDDTHAWLGKITLAPAFYFRKIAPASLTVVARASDGKIGAAMMCVSLPEQTCVKMCSCCLDPSGCWNFMRNFSMPPWRNRPSLKEHRKFIEKRMAKMAEVVKPLHHNAVSGTHWYLALVGVDPKYQGQGLGGKLVRSLSAQADADNVPCYLETTGLRNVAIYKKCGYEVAGEVAEVVCDGDEQGSPTLSSFFAMVRQPRGEKRPLQ